MSDQHGGSMQPVRPLTRREIREREAAAAEQAAGSAPPASGGFPPPPPAPAPEAPVAPAGPPPSRRSMREPVSPTAGDGFPSQAPVVRPPSMTGGMRGVDQTGRLTPIQETVEHVAIRPNQAPPAGMTPPVRQSMRAPAPAPSPFEAPASRPTRAPQAAPAAPPAAPVPSPFPPSQTAAPARESVSSRIQPSETPRAAATPAPAQPTLPWQQATAPVAPAPVVPQAPVAEAAPALPWETVTMGAAAGSAAAPPAPFGAPVAAHEEQGDSPFPSAGGTRPGPSGRRAADDEPDEDERPPGHPYTWLHYLILIAVAFVLGLLIWQMLLNGSAAEAAAAAPSETVASATHPYVGLSS
ncbi:hypothetical protein [Oerskovia merdavium]|uniref:Uncharacterized protein n=1 Tax=Oerskovia merdavium TaxID=2762227 RepID=A0ABR8U095_9CELL|nr:hypothetical protein [Oerskovia merdavium]MBD7981165.1 hypothetical protein [Oerskovia merdavium]